MCRLGIKATRALKFVSTLNKCSAFDLLSAVTHQCQLHMPKLIAVTHLILCLL